MSIAPAFISNQLSFITLYNDFYNIENGLREELDTGDGNEREREINDGNNYFGFIAWLSFQNIFFLVVIVLILT